MPRALLSKGPRRLTLRGQMEKRRPSFLRSTAKPAADLETTGTGVSETGQAQSALDTSGIREMRRGNNNNDNNDDLSPDMLIRQNFELRHRLEEETASYKRRLNTYRQAQQHQAALVSRLQAKVLQYKQRCSELENQMTESLPLLMETTSQSRIPIGGTSSSSSAGPSLSALEAAHQTLRDLREEEEEQEIHDLETALRKLAEERRRTGKIIELNTALKKQLEESHRTNESLTNDLQKLSTDWEVLREEMACKEDEWKEEEIAFNEYYTSEHHRLLNLWRDVVSLKRVFSDIKSSTERDLTKFTNKLSTAMNDMTSACSGVKLALQISSLVGNASGAQRPQAPPSGAESLDSKVDNKLVTTLKQQYEVAQNDIRVKDERINQLIREIHNLEERCSESEARIGQAVKIQENMEILESALRDIAHAVIQDAESKVAGDVGFMQTGSISQQRGQPPPPLQSTSPKSQRGIRSNTIPAFAESTISAVQAALHKYQLTIHELQVKLQTNAEQLLLTRRQCESAEENVQLLEDKTTELIAQLDVTRAECTQLVQERDMLQKGLDTIRSEKNYLEKQKVELTHTIESLNGDIEKLQKVNNKLQKICDSVEDEKIYLQNELDRINKEFELRELSFRSEEERCSRVREELLTIKEELNKVYLVKDMLEQQKMESDHLISQIDKNKGDVELELEKILLEKSDIQNELMKFETICGNHEKDKLRLQDELKKLEEERNKLANQCSDQQGDLGSLKKELLQAEQLRLDLEADKVILNEKIKFLENEKEKVEMELSQVMRERGDLSNQLSVLARKKESLTEELMRTRQRLEQANEMNARINRNLEDLVKDNEEKQVIIESNDKEFQRMQELLASMRSEKETLEGVLFDTQTNLEETHLRKVQLESEQQDLLVKYENLKGQLARLTKDLEASEKRCQDIKQNLTQAQGNQEAEYQQIITNLKKQHETTSKKLNDEKEQIKQSLEKKLQQTVNSLSNQKDDELNQLQVRIEELQQHIDNLCQQHEEALVRAENDKQQSLMIAHHDQQALMEKIETLMRELEGERTTLERLKREANSRADQDRTNINQLRDELSRIKMKLEETKLQEAEDKMKLELKMEDIRKERENAQKECEELTVQIHVAEDKVDSLQNQLQETSRKLKDTENTIESHRKELVDTKRQLQDSNYAMDKYNSTNKELREYVKRIEGEKREQSRALEDAYEKITSIENMKSTIEAEKIRLAGQIRDLEHELIQNQQQLRFTQDELEKNQSANSQAQNDERELQARLSNEIEERERVQLQLHQFKKQVIDLDNNLEVTRQELGKLRAKTDEEDERWRTREQELLMRLEDSRCRERKLEDQKHNLEVCLADASQQIQELKARFGGAEGRVRALDSQLSQLEATKKEVEQKLSSVVTTLRRIAGIQLDGSLMVNMMPFKLMSPSRRWSPSRISSSTAAHHHHQHQDMGNREGRDVLVVDVDPEAIRRGVRSLMQQVAQIERERDDYKNELNTAKKQITETQECHSKTENKIASVSMALKNLEAEKASLSSQLSQKQVSYDTLYETLNEKSQEIEYLREKVTTLEFTVSSESEGKAQYEEKMEKMRQALQRLENEKRGLQEDLGRSESRATKLELQRMSLEGDLQRLQMILQEKDGNLQKLQDRLDAQLRTSTGLEERCASLKSTIEQLNVCLERAATSESELKTEINNLRRTMVENNAAIHSSNDKIKHLQKQLSNAENERRVYSERLDAAQQQMMELKHANQTLMDQISRLQSDVANCQVEKSGLESQLRLVSNSNLHHRDNQFSSMVTIDSNKDQKDELVRQLHAIQRDRSEMRGKVEALNEKVKSLETDKRNLERQLSSARSGSTSMLRSKSYKDLYGSAEKGHIDSLGIDQEKHRELKGRIRRLDNLLAEKEAEILRLKTSSPALHLHSGDSGGGGSTNRDRIMHEIERLRAAQLQAEKLLEAREQSHRQQVLRLENQIQLLREQLSQEMKRRQLYVLRSARAGREMQHLRQALGDSLRTVAQDPSLDAVLLEHETRKLDTTVNTTSLPPSLALPEPPSLDRISSPIPSLFSPHLK